MARTGLDNFLTQMLQPQFYPIDEQEVKQMADQIGPTEASWNRYQSILNICDKYRNEGLTPLILSDGSKMLVTSEEHYTYGKFN